MMTQSDDDIVLAAEFALGTLATDERAQAETRMAVDADFRRAVIGWEGQLGTLNQMVGSIEPRPDVWQRIREALGHAKPQSSPQFSSAEREVAPHLPRSNVIAFESRVGPWRAIALSASAIAAALIALIAVQAYRPELLPWAQKTPPPRQVVQTAPVVAPPAAQYVALLQKDGASPAFIMTVNARTKSFTIRRLADPPESGRSYELWLVSDKLQRPRSLGVVGATEFTTRPVLASYDTDTVNSATYAVTIEPEGGAPNGVATGPVVYSGKLVEAVPPTTTNAPPPRAQ